MRSEYNHTATITLKAMAADCSPEKPTLGLGGEGSKPIVIVTLLCIILLGWVLLLCFCCLLKCFSVLCSRSVHVFDLLLPTYAICQRDKVPADPTSS